MVDYANLAQTYGRLGGLDRTATLVKSIRADRGDDKVLLLDGGDTWQGSYTSLKTNGQDMVDAMAMLKPDAMVGHWEFTFGVDRVNEIIESMNYPFLGGNVFDTEWEEPVFESTAFFEKGGVKVAVIGQHFPYTPQALKINKTLLLSSGSHGKYLGRIDLDVKGGEVVDYSSTLIPVFSDVITPDPEMSAHIDALRAPYEAECNRVIGSTSGLLYRRGNFNGTWDDLICQGIIEERDVEISLSPGFRWGTTLLPGQDITIDDLYTQTSMSYPNVYRTEMTGAQIKTILEDVCDNLFNIDPFYQQGGDMVRVGGMNYTCAPKASMGNRISDLTMTKTGEKLDADRKYVVGGWASVNENVEGPAIYDLMEGYISRKKSIDLPAQQAVKVIGL